MNIFLLSFFFCVVQGLPRPMKFKTDARDIIQKKIRQYLFSDRNRVAPGDFKKLQRSSQINMTLSEDLQDLLYDQKNTKDMKQFGSKEQTEYGEHDYAGNEPDYDRDNNDYDDAYDYEAGNEEYEYEEGKEEYDYEDGSGDKKGDWVYEENSDETQENDKDSVEENFLKEDNYNNEVIIDDYRTTDYEAKESDYEQKDLEYEYTDTKNDTTTDDSFVYSDDSLITSNDRNYDDYQAVLLKISNSQKS